LLCASLYQPQVFPPVPSSDRYKSYSDHKYVPNMPPSSQRCKKQHMCICTIT
jgi:hypothetical protein